MPPLHYRLRIRNAADSADDLVVTSIPGGVHPYIAEDGIPEGDGQTVNTVTGEVVSGAMTVGVIDVITDFSVDELLVDDGLEDVDQAAAEARGWVFDDSFSGGAWAVGASDQVYAGTRAFKAAISGGEGVLTATKVFMAADGIQPLTQYPVFVRARAKDRAWFDVGCKLYVTGSTGPTEAAVTVANEFQLLRVVATSTVDATLTVQLYRNGGFGQARDSWFDALEIWTHTTGEGRIVTSRLADAQGRPQLLSRRAYLEETADGVTFPVLMAGYVTMQELTTAMRWTFGIGESRRVEESVRVFEVAEPGFDRMSCLVGGPVIGDFGPYTDHGLPRFTVTDVTGSYVTLEWTGGELFGPFNETGPPCRANVRDYINALAAPYLGYFGQTVNGLAVGGAPYDLVARLFDIGTGPGTTEGLDGYDFTPVGILIFGTLFTNAALLNSKTAVTLWWPAGNPGGLPSPPAEGARFKMAIFPTTISERNPLHWRGHPMDLATGLMTLRNQPFDAGSAADVRAALGDTLVIEIRITAGMSLKNALEKFVYGPFGVSARPNDAGILEFFSTRRRPSAAPSGTITLADLIDPSPPVWRIEEGSAVNKVTVRLKNFTGRTDLPANSNDGFGSASPASDPIDYMGVVDQSFEAVPNPSDYEVYGDRSVTYELPGRLVVTDPIGYVAALGAELFEERGRGAIISQLAVRRDGPDPRIGEETILDLPHLPTANPTQSPVSQRGTTPRIALVLRRTPTPAGPLLTVQDRGIALQAGLVPEFTIAPSGDEPRKIATIAITNGPALAAAGVTVRVEWAVSSTTPLTSQLLRTLDPATDALTFDLPAVDAGARVWARMRTEQVGTRPGTWSDFADADLDDLDAPTAFAGTLSGGFIDLTWTLGANAADIPIELLLREDADPDFDSVVVLPIGSTQYRLQLPVSETDYVIGVRHHEAAPFAGVSSTTTLDVTSEPTIGLSAPINPAVFADGAGTFGVEVTATVLPSGTEFWVAVETAIGSDTPDTSAAVQLLPSVAGGRTRFTNPSIAANDGKRRYLKARHVVGAATSDFCAELGVFPWLLLPPGDPVPDPEPPIGITRLPIDLCLAPFHVLDIPAEVTPLTPWRNCELQFPFDGYLSVRLEATIATAGPVGSYLVAEMEPVGAAGTFAVMGDGGVGPVLPLDEASLDLLDPGGALRVPKLWVVAGAPVMIRDEGHADIRARLSIGGGDGTGQVVAWRSAIQPVAGTPDLPPPEREDPPPDAPGSCTAPSALDVQDHDSQIEPSGADWDVSGSDVTLTLDGTGSGLASQTVVFTGTPDTLYTFYLTVNPDADVPVFFTAGTDTATSEGTGAQTLSVHATTDGSGNLTLVWGVATIEDAPDASGSDDLSHADQAAAEAAGWVFTNTNTGGSFAFDTGYDIDGFLTSMSLLAKNNGVGHLRMERTFSVVNGQNYRGRLWADASGTEPWWSAMTLTLTSGANTFGDSINGGVASKHLDVTIAANGVSLTVRIEIAPVAFFNGVKPWRVAGFTLDGLSGGGAAIVFSDLGVCEGSGLGDGGTGLGEPDPDDPDGPGVDPIPDPPPGGYEPWTGTRRMGMFNLPIEGLGYLNSTVKIATRSNLVDLKNRALTADSYLYLFMGSQQEWLDATGKWTFELWKAAFDRILDDARAYAALVALIAAERAAHFVNDEPYTKVKRYGYSNGIPITEMERCCQYSKSVLPDLPTMISLRPVPQRWWMTRHIDDLDWLACFYSENEGDCATFRDQNIARAIELDHGLLLAPHYAHIQYPSSGSAYATPAQALHYGTICATPPPSNPTYRTIGMLSWKYLAAMYTPDFVESMRRVRNTLASFD
jgi:hypothetical protein